MQDDMVKSLERSPPNLCKKKKSSFCYYFCASESVNTLLFCLLFLSLLFLKVFFTAFELLNYILC